METVNDAKVRIALRFVRAYGDTQEARHRADQQGHLIDGSQWMAAGKLYYREKYHPERMYKPGCPTCGSSHPSENRSTCPNHAWHAQPPFRATGAWPVDED